MHGCEKGVVVDHRTDERFEIRRVVFNDAYGGRGATPKAAEESTSIFWCGAALARLQVSMINVIDRITWRYWKNKPRFGRVASVRFELAQRSALAK
jgi:hypothetical protein